MFIRLICPGILLAACLLAACHPSTSATGGTFAHPSRYPAVWYDSLSQALGTYEDLGQALHREDTALASTEAGRLQTQLAQLPKAALGSNEDSVELIETTLGSLHAELDGLRGETDLAGKRDEYRMVSDIWHDLLLLTGLKGSILYLVRDAAALDGHGATWLQQNPAAGNPYRTPGAPRYTIDTLRFQ